jgi:hypothetical protein
LPFSEVRRSLHAELIIIRCRLRKGSGRVRFWLKNADLLRSGLIKLGFLANLNPYGPAKVKPENLTEFSDAKNPYIIPN